MALYYGNMIYEIFSDMVFPFHPCVGTRRLSGWGGVGVGVLRGGGVCAVCVVGQLLSFRMIQQN